MTELDNGVTLSNPHCTKDNNIYFKLTVPATATGLTFNLSGGSGDADLYVRKGTKQNRLRLPIL